MSFYVGCDPGYSSGCLCFLSYDFKDVEFYDITDRSKEGMRWHTPLINLFKAKKNEITRVAIELVNPSFNQGVVSAGHFKGAAMVIEALSEAAGHIPLLVTPTKWQESLGVSVAKDKFIIDDLPEDRKKSRAKNKVARKKATYAWAVSKFPEIDWRSFSKDGNRADALGIAFWLSQQSLQAS